MNANQSIKLDDYAVDPEWITKHVPLLFPFCHWGFEVARRSPLIPPLSLINSNDMGTCRSSRWGKETRIEDRKTHIQSLHINIRLDALERCEDSPQPAAREDYSHMISRSKIEIIVANTWIEITIFLQWSPILKEISITMVMAMTMEEMGDGMDELWWWISFGVV